jgi:hypothetical protein
MAPAYEATMRFVLAAAPEAVVAAVFTPERWLRGMRHLRRLERLADGHPADPAAVRYRVEVAAALPPYRLRWEMAASHHGAPRRVRWWATGDLEGSGSWELEEHPTGTAVTSRASLRPTRRWMRVVEPLARPVFVRNHDAVFRAGVAALAEHLGAEVVAHGTHHVDPRP